MPTALSAFVSNVPYNPPNHTISKTYTRFLFPNHIIRAA